MAEDEQTAELKNTVTIEDVGPCKKKVCVEIPEEAVRSATDEQYENLRKEAIVPGFRRGRAPRRLLEKRFGKETNEQIKLKLLADASDSAIKDNEVDVLRDPDVDFENIELPEAGPLKFDFEVEVRPEFDLPELEGIAVEKTKLEVTDEQVNREIEQLRRWSGIWAPREGGAAELEDQVIADVVLKAEDVEEEQKLDNVEIYVRQNGFVGAVPVEKLDEVLTGAKAGETRETSVDVPKTYFREEYRGKKVDVKITVKDIKCLKPAAVDEGFFKRLGVEDEDELGMSPLCGTGPARGAGRARGTGPAPGPAIGSGEDARQRLAQDGLGVGVLPEVQDRGVDPQAHEPLALQCRCQIGRIDRCRDRQGEGYDGLFSRRDI